MTRQLTTFELPSRSKTHGVPAKDSFNSSIAMYRIHKADAIHSPKRIRFQFVNPWNPERLRPFAYFSVAFYYLDSLVGRGLPPARSSRPALLQNPRSGSSEHPVETPLRESSE